MMRRENKTANARSPLKYHLFMLSSCSVMELHLLCSFISASLRIKMSIIEHLNFREKGGNKNRKRK